ncbi:MAG: hypothetical protein ACK6BG_14645 [Cyanobacteriota bacterium]|jgi:hypothetical protein
MTLRRHPASCAAERDGRICLIDPDNAESLNRKAIGSAVWTLLEAPMDRVQQLLIRMWRRWLEDRRRTGALNPTVQPLMLAIPQLS